VEKVSSLWGMVWFRAEGANPGSKLGLKGTYGVGVSPGEILVRSVG